MSPFWAFRNKLVDEFQALGSQFGAKTVYIKSGVANQESLNAGFGRALETLGSTNGCVSTARVAIDKPLADQTWEEFSRIQEINVGIISWSPVQINTGY